MTKVPSSGSDAACAPRGMQHGGPQLAERDADILDFERRWWQHEGSKEQSIREEFGISATRYYQLLGALIDSPAALVHDPMLVKRLQRTRDARIAARAARTLSTGD